MIYTHVLNRGGRGVHSPLDRVRKPMEIERAEFRPTGDRLIQTGLNMS
jgi:hypothetical protein